MLDPAGGGENLGEFLLGGRNHPHAGIEKDRAGRGGTLIDGKDMGHGGSFRLTGCPLWDRTLYRLFSGGCHQELGVF
jgi:hypothetical protein